MFERILSIARKHQIMIFSDEMYGFLDNLSSAVMMDSVNENIISLSGMSKTFCMPGVRIGWLITRNVQIMKKFQNFKDYVTICSSAPSENLSILALRNGNYSKIISRLKEIIRINVSALYTFVGKNADIFYWTQYEQNGGLTKFIGYKME